MKQAKDTRLIHYSAIPLGEIYSVEQCEEIAMRAYKPNGLWVSVGDDWLAWCRDEDFCMNHWLIANVINLSESANLLRLSTAKQIDEFTRLYGQSHSAISSLTIINWPKVASTFDGIIIAPYIWARRLTHHTMWYYGWDCASGCIWNASAIAQIQSEPVPEQARLCNQEYA